MALPPLFGCGFGAVYSANSCSCCFSLSAKQGQAVRRSHLILSAVHPALSTGLCTSCTGFKQDMVALLATKNYRLDHFFPPAIGAMEKKVLRGAISHAMGPGTLFGCALPLDLLQYSLIAIGVQWTVFVLHALPSHSEKYYDGSVTLTVMVLKGLSLHQARPWHVQQLASSLLVVPSPLAIPPPPRATVIWPKKDRKSAGPNLVPPPTHPSKPPKVVELVFLQCEILGKSAGAFFFRPLEWVILFFTLCVYAQNAKNTVENSKMGEKHKKHLTSDLTSGSDLG